MNYRKTKTINKQGTMLKSTFLSVLLLFLLNACGGGQHSTPGGRPISQRQTEKNANEKAIMDFIVELGGWGPCTAGCFLSQIREDAVINNNQKKKKNESKINGVASYSMPKGDNDQSYFAKLLGEKLVGNQEGRNKWQKMIRKGKVNPVFTENGISGIFAEIVTIGLGSQSFNRGVGIYVVVQYMEFVDKVREILLDNKQQVRPESAIDKEELKKAFGRLETQLEKVASNKSGVVLIIPIDPNAYTPKGELTKYEEDAQVYFEIRPKKMMASKKGYTLKTDEEKKFKDINQKIAGALKKIGYSVKE